MATANTSFIFSEYIEGSESDADDSAEIESNPKADWFDALKGLNSIFKIESNKLKKVNENDAFVRLSKPRRNYSSSFNQQKKEDEDLTFKPDISRSQKTFNQLREKKKYETDETLCGRSVTQRLFEDHLERENTKVKIDEAKNKHEKQEFTFRPKLNATSKTIVSKSNYIPLYELERQNEIIWKREHKLLVLRQEKDEKDMDFIPLISEKSRNLAAHANAEKVVENRLIQKGETFRENIKKKKIQNDEQLFQRSFKPKINEKSKNLALSLGSNVFEREETLRLQRKPVVRYESSFKPVINDMSRILAANFVKEKKKHDVSNEYTFKPRINALSRVLAASKVKEKETRREKVKIAQKEKLEKEDVECTFKPTINTNIRVELSDNYLNVRNPSDLNTRIKVQQMRKLETIERIRKERDKKITKTCSFKPVLNKKRRSNKKAVLVRGLGNFLKRHDDAKQKVNEKKKLERKLFYQDIMKRPGKLQITVPKPFHLS